MVHAAEDDAARSDPGALLEDLSMGRAPSSIGNRLRGLIRFVGGPFPLSVALHVAALLFLIITIHEQRWRELILVNLEPGGGGGGGDEVKTLDTDMVAMPESEPPLIEGPTAIDISKVPSVVAGVARSENEGIGIGGGGGVGSGQGPGFGPGGFGGYIGVLRRTGLDVALVIDGTRSMNLIIDDVRAKMAELVGAIHTLVPIARVGIVVFGGEGEPMQLEPLTLNPQKLVSFLSRLQAKGGGEWEEDTYGAIDTAVNRLDWKPFAKKVIVLVGDSPPQKDDYAPLLALIRQFRQNNGTLNTIDVTQLEHDRFERAFWMRVHNEVLKQPSPLPAFYRQTRSAFEVLAKNGGGVMRSLAPEGGVNQQVMILIFGDEWKTQIASFSRQVAVAPETATLSSQ